MANTILIDGIDFSDSVRFPEGFSVTYAKDDSSKTVNLSISSGIVFVRESFNYLESKFFPTPFNPAAKDREAAVTISTDCCNQSYDFIIRADAVTYCPEACQIETQGFERSDDLKASDRLRNHRILTDQEGILSEVTPKTKVCIQSFFGQALLHALISFLTIFFQILFQIFSAFGFPNPATQLNSFLDSIAGCFGSIRLFYLRDIFEEAAAAAGLTASSSILQSHPLYSNAAWLDTQAASRIDTAGQILFPPQSNLYAPEWLDILSIQFNADWQIRNGELIFERKDFFTVTSSVLVNADNAYDNNLAEVAPCYTYTDQQKVAFGRFQYTEDNDESIGNEALPRYNDIVEFNDPFDPNKKGALNVNIPTAAARFVGDGLDGKFTPTIFGGRTVGTLLLKSDLPNVRSLPKILVLTGSAAATSDPNWLNAKVIERTNPTTGDREFNYPMFINEGDADGLYENFFKIDDPRETPNTPYVLDDFEFLFTCEQVNLIRNNGLDVLIETRLGNGSPEEIVINFDRKTITVKGTKLAQ